MKKVIWLNVIWMLTWLITIESVLFVVYHITKNKEIRVRDNTSVEVTNRQAVPKKMP